MIGERISAMVFFSVPMLAFWALSPVWTTSQARELSPLLAASTDDVGTDGDDASREPITDLSDWNYTANPMSPIGKTSFSRRLLSNQPGAHPTPGGPNPRVPWLTQPASSGNANLASVDPTGVAVSAVQAFATPSAVANAPQGSAGSTNPGNVQGTATPNTQATLSTTAVMPTLAMLQNIMPTALQPVAKPSFQPVKSKWQDRATRMKLGRGAAASSN